jgi:hypothetical protein
MQNYFDIALISVADSAIVANVVVLADRERRRKAKRDA